MRSYKETAKDKPTINPLIDMEIGSRFVKEGLCMVDVYVDKKQYVEYGYTQNEALKNLVLKLANELKKS